MLVSGVRNSWLMLAMKRDLARLSSSAISARRCWDRSRTAVTNTPGSIWRVCSCTSSRPCGVFSHVTTGRPEPSGRSIFSSVPGATRLTIGRPMMAPAEAVRNPVMRSLASSTTRPS